VSKPRLAIAPRKPVPEADARRLEELLERKSDAIAGGTPASQQDASSAPTPSVDLYAAEAPRSAPAKQQRTTAEGPARARKSRISEIPLTGIGTRANPRVRKLDGVKTRSTSVHLPIELALELTMHCARAGLRQSEVITQALEDWLERER
jgi:hypothetical protein